MPQGKSPPGTALGHLWPFVGAGVGSGPQDPRICVYFQSTVVRLYIGIRNDQKKGLDKPIWPCLNSSLLLAGAGSGGNLWHLMSL